MSTINYLDPESNEYKEIPLGDAEASEISYNNAQSGLAAKNVQEAVDEIKTEMDTIPSKRRAIVGINGSISASNQWFKFGEVIVASVNVDPWIIFRVTSVYGENALSGVLYAHIRQGTPLGVLNGTQYVWESFYSSRPDIINPDNFVLAYKIDEQAGITVELWCKLPTIGYYHLLFEVLAEGRLLNNYLDGYWTLYSDSTGTSDIPSGYVRKPSTYLIGTTDISAIADGTITGAIKKLSESAGGSVDYLYSIYFTCRNNTEGYKLNAYYDDDVSLTIPGLTPGERIQYIPRPGHQLTLSIYTNIKDGGSTSISIGTYDMKYVGFENDKRYTKDSNGYYQLGSISQRNIHISM